MESYLFIINNAPYGDERSYNALRLAMNLAKREDTQVKVFLMADAVTCARKAQKTPDGYYNTERMIKVVAAKARWPPESLAVTPAGLGSKTSPKA